MTEEEGVEVLAARAGVITGHTRPSCVPHHPKQLAYPPSPDPSTSTAHLHHVRGPIPCVRACAYVCAARLILAAHPSRLQASLDRHDGDHVGR